MNGTIAMIPLYLNATCTPFEQASFAAHVRLPYSQSLSSFLTVFLRLARLELFYTILM